jgi:uncharacterized protein YbjT (DUF2867 family)
MRIAVAGGTGVVGRYVVEAARGEGHEVVVLARRAGVDVLSGSGLDAALDRVDAVVDTLNVGTQKASVATEFFETTSRHLLEAGARAGVRHHVLLSIVGIDEPGLGAVGYYAGKRAQEAVVRAGAVPWSVQRATQFHEFAGQLLARMSRGPVVLVPQMTSQPVAAAEVGRALASLAARGALGRAPDLAGPRRERVPAMVRQVARAQGSRRVVLPLPVPGAMGRAMRGGSLCLRSGTVAGPTFADWLAAAYPGHR